MPPFLRAHSRNSAFLLLLSLSLPQSGPVTEPESPQALSLPPRLGFQFCPFLDDGIHLLHRDVPMALPREAEQLPLPPLRRQSRASLSGPKVRDFSPPLPRPSYPPRRATCRPCPTLPAPNTLLQHPSASRLHRRRFLLASHSPTWRQLFSQQTTEVCSVPSPLHSGAVPVIGATGRMEPGACAPPPRTGPDAQGTTLGPWLRCALTTDALSWVVCGV